MTDIDKTKKCAKCGLGGELSTLNERYCAECTRILLDEMLERMRVSNPRLDLEAEFGKLLMKHIDEFAPAGRKRYYELKEILEDHGKQRH